MFPAVFSFLWLPCLSESFTVPHTFSPLSSPLVALPPPFSFLFLLLFLSSLHPFHFIVPIKDNMVDIFKSSPHSLTSVMEGVLGSTVPGPLRPWDSWGSFSSLQLPPFDFMPYIPFPWFHVHLLKIVKEGKMHQVCGSSDVLCSLMMPFRVSFLETGSELESCMQNLLKSTLKDCTWREVKTAELARQETVMQCSCS